MSSANFGRCLLILTSNVCCVCFLFVFFADDESLNSVNSFDCLMNEILISVVNVSFFPLLKDNGINEPVSHNFYGMSHYPSKTVNAIAVVWVYGSSERITLEMNS